MWKTFFSCLVIQAFCQKCDYEKFSSKHTACLPQNRSCTILKSGVSPEDQLIILHAHNSYRNKVANGSQPNLPSASNMIQLEWDEEIAKIAQHHAEQCRAHHDCPVCRRTATFSWVTQNLYNVKWVKVHRNSQWSKVVRLWFSKVKRFSEKQISPAGITRANSHFTTMTWATSSVLGCGYVAFKNTASDGKKFPVKQIFLCNYAPGGNKQGFNGGVYRKGQACAKCPADHQCSDLYPALCLKNRTN